METRSQLVGLFRDAYAGVDLLSPGGSASSFGCPRQHTCQFDCQRQSSWSPAFGDAASRVMLVAEAPSAKNAAGPGVHSGGVFRDWSVTRDPALSTLRDFVFKRYGAVPHFTDLMKCGVSRQTPHQKKVFKIRMEQCFQQFLQKEIAIVRPCVILCIGEVSYKALHQVKSDGLIAQDIALHKLLHYSRQAALPVSLEEKRDIIWRLQLGDTTSSSISELSYIRKSTRGL